MLKVRLSKLDEALVDLNYYLNLSEDFNAYFERGKIYLFKNKKNDACKDFYKAIALGNNNEELIYVQKENCK
ncbi:hypothetical protein [Chryseobacterium indoltheticum]|uniref:hypothetical protein n=1 Tax=Chryseobacterium indoltheticum TaxID=254 RepID=UPI003F49900A